MHNCGQEPDNKIISTLPPQIFMKFEQNERGPLEIKAESNPSRSTIRWTENETENDSSESTSADVDLWWLQKRLHSDPALLVKENDGPLGGRVERQIKTENNRAKSNVEPNDLRYASRFPVFFFVFFRFKESIGFVVFF